LTGIALALIAAACAFIPQRNPRLDEARREYQHAVADPEVARYAAAELRLAAELLEQASLARDTLDDVAVVDHLAYVAKQRVAIARESAKLRAKAP
jgi:hypothetical protein